MNAQRTSTLRLRVGPGVCALFMATPGVRSGSDVQPPGAVPPAGTIITSTRQVNCLAAGPDGVLWVGSAGGILRRSADGKWQKFTRNDGLLSHEVRHIRVEGSTVTASFPTGIAVWKGAGWASVSARPGDAYRCEATWRGKTYTSETGKFTVRRAGVVEQIALPPSIGTHVSALLSRPDGLLAGLYNDGLWTYDGTRWQVANVGLPTAAREITALADDGHALWVGTRRAGVWQYDGARWTQYLQPDEPVDHNAQNMALFQGRLVVGTLEDGLAVREGDKWLSVQVPAISSNAPRQMVEFQGKLYVRHGGGMVDAWDGQRWDRDICARLQRPEVSCLATDGSRLFAGQWGGWSEFDGMKWEAHLGHPELQGVPTTALLSDAETVWIGTQGKGVAQYNRKTGALAWHDARHGLADDWIVCMARAGNAVVTGTFVGGLARWDGGKWTTHLRGENVTALHFDGIDGMYAATRNGVWRITRSAAPEKIPVADTEVQCLVLDPAALWLGTRTGIYVVGR